MTDSNPYSNLGPERYWKSGVATGTLLRPQGLYKKKFVISAQDRVAAAGSCFAQHISKRLRGRGFQVMDVEPAPNMLPMDARAEFGYGLYSARYGNIYTARQLLQLAQEAFDERASPEPVWVKADRYYDSARPSVEPAGLETAAEVIRHRSHHLSKVKEMFEQMDVFIFTLGLTETWKRRDSSWVFPTAPSTIAGRYDPDVYEFVNLDYSDVVQDLREFMALLGRRNKSKNLRMLLTVSPVPLTATFEDEHVLCATTYSKSVLRAAAGYLTKKHEWIDYFPSFEIISNPWNRGVFYSSNCRTVENVGVDSVMDVFFSQHRAEGEGGTEESRAASRATFEAPEETQCEEALLEQFSRTK